jgi:hypothetical protein
MKAGQHYRLRKQKSHPKVADSLFLVARGGIEPPTQGFSILANTRKSALMCIPLCGISEQNQ